MFGIILTQRGSSATSRQPDINRVIPLPRWEPTSPQFVEEPTAGSPRGRPAAEEPSPGLRIFEPESRTARETSLGRARHLLGTVLRYIDHPSFDDPSAHDAILAAMPEPELTQASAGEPHHMIRISDESPLMSREQEAHLFRKMNYLKAHASRLRDRIDPDRPCTDDLDEIERHLDEAQAIRTQIVCANLRLVVHIAKRYLGPRENLFERVSDGNYVMIRAVERFDYSRGNKFSTYATWAIRNHFARADRGKNSRHPQSLGGHDAVFVVSDPHTDELEQSDSQERRQEAVARLLGRLGDRERRILVARYGIGGGNVKTLGQLGMELGITKERVRQIEGRAREKLRRLARTEASELLPA